MPRGRGYILASSLQSTLTSIYNRHILCRNASYTTNFKGQRPPVGIKHINDGKEKPRRGQVAAPHTILIRRSLLKVQTQGQLRATLPQRQLHASGGINGPENRSLLSPKNPSIQMNVARIFSSSALSTSSKAARTSLSMSKTAMRRFGASGGASASL